MNIPYQRTLFFAVFLFIEFSLQAQMLLSGEVIDAATFKPVAFVHVYDPAHPDRGTYTDIDGRFSIRVDAIPVDLHFSIIGYQKHKQRIQTTTAQVRISASAVELPVVTFSPGQNPAEILIKRLINKRDTLNPNKLGSYTYTAYHKFLFTGLGEDKSMPDSTKNLQYNTDDTLQQQLGSILQRQHLFINETVSEKRFMKPDRHYEKITASRTSGMELPIFSTLMLQMQSISFYDNTFSMLGSHYLNPISIAGLRQYEFEINDTLIYESDTIVAISYRPRKGSAHDLMKGFLHVNINRMALVSAVAEPAAPSSFHITIKQLYQSVDSIRWFPVQLQTDITSSQMSFGKTQLVAEGRTYIRDIKINPSLKAGNFGAIEIDVDEHAVSQGEQILSQHREHPLQKKDSATYVNLEKYKKKINIDRRILALENLLDGKLTIRFIDIEIPYLFNYNNYEGVRIGAGLSTNTYLVKWWTIGAYMGYGFKDKSIKYGAYTEFIPHKKTETRIRFTFQRDLIETATSEMPLQPPIRVDNLARSYTLNQLDSVQLFEVSAQTKPVKNLHLRLAVSHQTVDPVSPYRFLPDTLPNQQFSFSEIHFTARWGIREKYRPLATRYLSLGTQYPILWFHVSQAIPILGCDYSFTRIMAKIEQQYDFKKGGKIGTMIHGGYVLNEAPINRLFSMRGSYAGFSIVSRSAFETMRSNEFVADKFISWFLYYTTPTLFRIGKVSKPEIRLVHNLGYGWMEQPQRHIDLEYKTMEKGFFETGFVLDHLLSYQGTGLGVGAFYRYGKYSDPIWYENIYVKLALKAGF